MYEMCIRCGENYGVTEEGMCGHCHWAFRAELDALWLEMRDYLRLALEFQEWCIAHGKQY